MTSASAIVNQLHAEYCQRTGFEIDLNFSRERQWGEWLSWRKGKPFTVEDLARVIGYIRQGISKGDRNDGALKFSNLVGSPDRFEEDLGLALKAIKPRTLPTSRIHKPLTAPAAGETLSPAEFERLRQEMGVSSRKPTAP